MALVLDTGVLFAALRADDPDHEPCSRLVAETAEVRVVPTLVLVELDYWLLKSGDLAAWVAFCEDLDAQAYTLFPLDAAALLRCARVQAKYADQPIGIVDASVLVTCELLGERKVATLDHRHFGVLRTAEGRALELLP